MVPQLGAAEHPGGAAPRPRTRACPRDTNMKYAFGGTDRKRSKQFFDTKQSIGLSSSDRRRPARREQGGSGGKVAGQHAGKNAVDAG